MTSLISAHSNQSFLHNSLRGTQADSYGSGTGASMYTLLDALFEAALLCRNGKIVYANSAACTLFGISLEALAGKCLSDCLQVKESLEGNTCCIPRSATHSEQAAILLRQDARPVGVAVREVILSSVDGDSAIGEQVLLVRERKEETRYSIPGRTLMELLPWPMLRLDSGLNYLHGNAVLIRKLASLARFSEGVPLIELGWPAAFCRALEEAVSCPKPTAGTWRIPLLWQVNRRRHHFIAELIPEHDLHGSLRSLLIVMHDTSSSKEEEVSSRLRHAQQAHEHALAASDARDAFFGWVSHELRTPLNGIQSWAHILETCVVAASDSPLITRALHGIRTGITQQLRLIEELMDVSRVIQGKLPLTCHTFVLAPAAQSAVESLRATALSRRIKLACRYPDEEILIESDPCRVQQALYLLLSHALERSPQDGSVSFRVLRRRRHAAICITHCCDDAATDANNQSDGNRPICQKDSRQQMNLLLARCLAERLGGNMTTRPSRTGDNMSHTLLLPLSGSTERQDR
jgi:signal transduction histidine kinase